MLQDSLVGFSAHTSTSGNSALTLLNAQQVCEVLQISRRTLTRWIRKNLINYVRIGGQYRFRPAAVELFVSQREVKRR